MVKLSRSCQRKVVVEVGKVKKKLAKLSRSWQREVGVEVSKDKKEVEKKGGS